MPRVTGIRKERRHIQMDKGMWDELTSLYAPQGVSNSKVINDLVAMHLRFIANKAAEEQAAREAETAHD